MDLLDALVVAVDPEEGYVVLGDRVVEAIDLLGVCLEEAHYGCSVVHAAEV